MPSPAWKRACCCCPRFLSFESYKFPYVHWGRTLPPKVPYRTWLKDIRIPVSRMRKAPLTDNGCCPYGKKNHTGRYNPVQPSPPQKGFPGTLPSPPGASPLHRADSFPKSMPPSTPTVPPPAPAAVPSRSPPDRGRPDRMPGIWYSTHRFVRIAPQRHRNPYGYPGIPETALPVLG